MKEGSGSGLKKRIGFGAFLGGLAAWRETFGRAGLVGDDFGGGVGGN